MAAGRDTGVIAWAGDLLARLAASDWLLRIGIALLIAGAGMWLARMLSRGLDRVMQRVGMEQILRDFLRNIAYALLPDRFTLGELQRAYEAILGRTLDTRNFQRKVRAIDLVEETGQLRTGQAHRPGRLFRFRVRRPMEIAVLT